MSSKQDLQGQVDFVLSGKKECKLLTGIFLQLWAGYV